LRDRLDAYAGFAAFFGVFEDRPEGVEAALLA